MKSKRKRDELQQLVYGAKKAIRGDSNDAKYDALVALVDYLKRVGPSAPKRWVVWKLAPDSDPEERYILTSPDGEIEHPLDLKFSSGTEACNFLVNNPQHDTEPKAEAVETEDGHVTISCAAYASLMTTLRRMGTHLDEATALRIAVFSILRGGVS